MADDDALARGLEFFNRVQGARGHAVLSRLDDVSPDLKELILRYAFGDIYSRPGLDLPTRQLCTITALATLNTSPLALQPHIHAALNVGCTREQIVEAILQVAVYAGMPASLNAMLIAKAAFAERDAEK